VSPTTYRCVFGGGWRSQDSDGRKAFWLGPNRENILLQSIWRSDTGGIPAVYCFNSKTGRTRFELADLFVEDVNSKRSHFLTTTWIWGRGWGADGAEPLRILAIWDADHVRSRRLGFDLAACHGACFVPTSPINPGHDSSHGYSGIAKKETHLRDSRILVFSARRYEQNLAKVYPLGSSHLYTVRLDGSGLRQITAGQGFDVFPSMSKDGKRVLFWRSRDPVYSWWIGSEMELYSVSLTGTDLRRMGQVADNTYRGSLVHTQRPSWIDVSHKTEEIIVSDRDGNVELTTDAYLYNPSGNRIIGAKYDRSPAEEGPPKHLIADQATHALAWVPAGYLAPVWIDDNLLVARVNGTKKFAILDSKGRELMRKEVRLNVEDQDSADPLADPEASFGRARRAFRLWSSRVFLMQDHHSLSTGGWDFVYRVDMNRGRAEFVCDQSIQGVSRDGFSFVGSEYRWVGAIKGPGAGWLGKMYLWDAKALTSKAIGFRLMETLGACFAKP